MTAYRCALLQLVHDRLDIRRVHRRNRNGGPVLDVGNLTLCVTLGRLRHCDLVGPDADLVIGVPGSAVSVALTFSLLVGGIKVKEFCFKIVQHPFEVSLAALSRNGVPYLQNKGGLTDWRLGWLRRFGLLGQCLETEECQNGKRCQGNVYACSR